MVYYDKKVIYLSEVEYGNRVKGAGFARMECRGESCSFDVHVSGMKMLAEKKYDIAVVSISGKEYLIGRIFLHNGAGEWKKVYTDGKVRAAWEENIEGREYGNGGADREFVGKDGVSYREIAEILVKISDTKALVGKVPYQEKAMQAAEITAAGDISIENGGEKRRNEGNGVWKFVRGGKKQENGAEESRRNDRQIDENAQVGQKKENKQTKREEAVFGNGWFIENGRIRENEYAEENKRAGDRETETNETAEENRQPPENVQIRVGRQDMGYGQVGERAYSEENMEEAWEGIDRGSESGAQKSGIGFGEVGGPQDRYKKEVDRQHKNAVSKRKMQSAEGKDKKNGNAEAEGRIQIDDVILDDKWGQLKQLYSVVHPYEDDRQYIAIQPKDFVIMTGDYQHLANNSFLLHGFYNYRHIVLGRERDGNFYLGVPGVYYEREKMVALMFGFEAFECKGGRAEAGEFGYYLRKVKI